MELDKTIIKNRFRKSISTYKETAVVQKSISKKLISILGKATTDDTFKSILEIGCGTGFLSEELFKIIKPYHLYINDIVDDMKCELESIFSDIKFNEWTFLSGDAEKIDFPLNLDLVISSSTFQWLENLPAFLEKISTSLKPNGILAFSTFGTDNYREIKKIMNRGLDYYTTDNLVNILLRNFKLLKVIEEHKILNFCKPIDVLKHIKYTGVNGFRNKIWNKKDLESFTREYTLNYSHKEGCVSLTYHPVYIIAQKK
jgi:malonyl-CoA O-methyltransferase